MTTIRTIFAIASAGLLTACSQYLPRYPAPLPSAETGYYENIQTPRLALLEYRIGKYLARKERPFPVICSSAGKINPHDPGSFPNALDEDVEVALIKRFPQLSPLSRCKRDGLDIVATDTGQPAAIFDVHEFVCDSPAECLGWGGYYANGLHGWSYYRMTFDRGEWRIKPEPLEIVLTGSEAS